MTGTDDSNKTYLLYSFKSIASSNTIVLFNTTLKNRSTKISRRCTKKFTKNHSNTIVKYSLLSSVPNWTVIHVRALVASGFSHTQHYTLSVEISFKRFPKMFRREVNEHALHRSHQQSCSRDMFCWSTHRPKVFRVFVLYTATVK